MADTHYLRKTPKSHRGVTYGAHASEECITQESGSNDDDNGRNPVIDLSDCEGVLQIVFLIHVSSFVSFRTIRTQKLVIFRVHVLCTQQSMLCM